MLALDVADQVKRAAEDHPSENIDHRAVDVTEAGQVRDALDEVAGSDRPLRIVVNCAGIAPSQRLVGRSGTHDLELFAKVVGVNLLGTLNVMTLAAQRIAAADALVDGARGVIVNTASVAAFDGQIGQAAYAASKAGVVGLTLPAARDLAQHGIRVNTICPGIIDTPMMATITPEFRSNLAAEVPFPKRLGRAEEYASLVAMIVEHDYLNGESIRMDGALRMAPR